MPDKEIKPMATRKGRLLAFMGLILAWPLLLALSGKGRSDSGNAVSQGGERRGILRIAETKQPSAISGEWKGTTTTTGGPTSKAGLTRDITLIITEKGGKLSGAYACSFGEGANAFCRNHDETGVISRGSLSGNKFTATIIVYPDFSHCEYSGTWSGAQIQGTYTCYLEGAIAELGNWEVKKIGKAAKET
jgi:hypothetical protein